MSGARGVAEAQWTAHLNSAVANAFRQMLAEKPPDPVARIGRLLTATVDGPAPNSVPPSPSPSDPMSQPQSDAAYNLRWSAHINATITLAWKQTFAARPADPVVHLGRLLLAASTAGAVTALEAENASLRAQLERERGAMRAIDQSLASSATSPPAATDVRNRRNPPVGSTAAMQVEIVGLRAQVKEIALEKIVLQASEGLHGGPSEEAVASPALQALPDQTQAVLAELKASLEALEVTVAELRSKQALELELGGTPTLLEATALQAENISLRAQVQELTLENEQLERKSAVQAVPGEEAAASPALQALRDQTQAVLAELEAAKPSTAAAGTTSLPDGLKDFTPLAKEPEIAAIAAGLHELELAVARNPTSEAALAALRAETEKLALATQAKIEARTAEARRAPPTADEVEAMWTELMPRLLEKVRSGIPGLLMSDEQKAKKAQATVGPLQAAWEKASVNDKPRLLRKAKKKAGEEESFVPLISECAAVILAGNRDFQKIYHAVYDVVRSGEADGIEAAQAAIAALGQAVRGDPKLLQQRDLAAETVALFADAVGALPAFAELVRCLSEATGARLEMASPGEVDKHGREQTGVKATKRMVEKAALRPGEGRGRTDRVCDVVRAMLVAKDMRTIGAIAEALRALQAAGLIEVRRIKDRFTQPSGGGWRDLMVNLVVLGSDGTVQHVCEVQVAHEMMLTARKGLPGHEVYAVQRNAVEFIESCGLEAELRRAMVQALRKEGKTHVEILSEFDDAWILEDAEWAAAMRSKDELLQGLEANGEGHLAAVKISNHKVTSLPESVGKCKGLHSLILQRTGLLSLPERLGECTALQTLQLDGCWGLLSLPERLGECALLQTLDLRDCGALLSLPERLGECALLKTLELRDCKGLLSVPDLSGLAQLEVKWLPDHLQPWKASGYKAFSFAAWLDTQIDEGTLTELRCPASLTSLPERLGELKTLQTLNLLDCKGLLSLPERLGECTGLQTLDLSGCSGLLSLPDLSGLAQLKVENLFLQPWAASGYKAFSFAAWLDTQIDEGTLTRLDCPTSLTSLPERLGECKALQTINLYRCEGLLSLPERLGECTALLNIHLSGCEGLLSLPERLGECTGLQRLNLDKCKGLLSLPDLSGLAQLKVDSLPDHLQPWAASGYKAFSISNEA